MPVAAPSDADLVRGAQAGDAGSLSLLLARHQARMRATAVSVLGYRHDVDDAVQEASITALRRIGDVRDPHAVSGWLRAIVRNQCRMQLKPRAEVPTGDPAALGPACPDLDPAEVVDRHALGDWIRHAVDELSPNLRLVTMLRYFTAVTSYDQIARACDVPIGTVRSRLSHARTQLAESLTGTADLAHDDTAATTAMWRRVGEQTIAAAMRGDLAEALSAGWSPEIETHWPQGKRTKGFDYLVRAMDKDVSDGVVHRLVNVVAGRDVVIWEADLISPTDDPFHCPPAVLWVHSLEAGRGRHLRLFHPGAPEPSRVAQFTATAGRAAEL